MGQEVSDNKGTSNAQTSQPDKEPRLRAIGKSALLIGLAAAVISVVLFVLSSALDDRATDLLLEGTFEEYEDATQMADLANIGAWIALVAAIPSIVGGLIAYVSYKM